MTQNIVPQPVQQPQAQPAQQTQAPPQAEKAASEQFANAVKGKDEGPRKGEKAEAGGPHKGDSPLVPHGNSPFSAIRGRQGGNREGGQEREQGGKDGPQPGDAILAGLFGQQVRQTEAPAGVGATAPASLDPGLTDKLVDRILVSAPDATGQTEVRLSLREDVLPGTEIRIQRAQDGSLHIQFVTDHPRAERALGAAQLTDLQQAIGQGLQVEVRVSTIRTDGSMSSDTGSSRDGGEGKRGEGGQSDGQGQQRSRQHDLFEGLDNKV